MRRTDVVQLGIISNIHINAANAKRAMTRCWLKVKPSMPRKEVGTHHRKSVTRSTIGRRTQYFTLNFFFPAVSIVFSAIFEYYF